MVQLSSEGIDAPADRLREAMITIHRALQQTTIPWLVGGSTGLLLQGIPLNRAPRDLDIYVDEQYAADMHHALSHFSVDEQVSSQTSIYRSTLSHYHIAGLKVELVGGFEVRSLNSEYIIEASYLYEHCASVCAMDPDQSAMGQDHVPIRLMPLAHELLFNVLRDRPDRYEAIAGFCRQVNRADHLRMMEELIRRNRIDAEVIQRIRELLAADSQAK